MNNDVDKEWFLAVNKSEFELGTLEDELRVDELCKKVLKQFYLQLLEDGLSPVEATELANSADYYVRDFVVSIKQQNLFTEKPGLVRQFAGNWYIVSTLEPDIKQLSGHLSGIKAFYLFLHKKGVIADPYLEEVEKDCADIPYYQQRIESFWNITGDGFSVWERECPLKG